jgi:hypothetical protein
MKKRAMNHLKLFMGDRPLLLLSIGITLLGVGYGIYMALSIASAEVQLATRYTAFGEVQFYRSHWYYLYALILFALIVVILHLAMMIKLSERNMRPLAISLGWGTLGLIVIMAIVSHSILGIAYLS